MSEKKNGYGVIDHHILENIYENLTNPTELKVMVYLVRHLSFKSFSKPTGKFKTCKIQDGIKAKSRPNVSVALNKLHEKGFINLRPDSNDGNIITLTGVLDHEQKILSNTNRRCTRTRTVAVRKHEQKVSQTRTEDPPQTKATTRIAEPLINSLSNTINNTINKWGEMSKDDIKYEASAEYEIHPSFFDKAQINPKIGWERLEFVLFNAHLVRDKTEKKAWFMKSLYSFLKGESQDIVGRIQSELKAVNENKPDAEKENEKAIKSLLIRFKCSSFDEVRSLLESDMAMFTKLIQTLQPEFFGVLIQHMRGTNLEYDLIKIRKGEMV